MTATTIRLPRASPKGDVIDTLSEFHESIRDVAAWAPSIVDTDGLASPRDARWLRAFLTGPLRWHLADEEGSLAPALGPDRSRWLDVSLEHAREKRLRLEEAADDLAALLDPLAAGEAVSTARYKAAARGFAAAADVALRYEDDIVLPTARLFLDASERTALSHTIFSADETRPWSDVAVAGDAPIFHRVHSVRVLNADGVDEVRSFADCPRRRSIGVDMCKGCAHLEGLHLDEQGCGEVACAIDTTRPPAHQTVGDVMTRDVVCVKRDTPLVDAVCALADAGVSGLPVVDHNGRAVGILSQSDVVGAIAGGGSEASRQVADVMMHVAFVAREGDAVDSAARLLVSEGFHRLPVVNADNVVVGIVSTLDLLRALLAAPDR